MAKIRFKILCWIICCASSAAVLTSAAIADLRLYGTTSDGDSGTSTLVKLDIDDGNLTETIGAVGFLVNGMAWDDAEDTLYASTSVNDGNFTGLITIDLATGAGAVVSTADWGQTAGYSVSNITMDTNEVLYGWTDNSNELVTIDKATGVATVLVGSTTIAAVDFGMSIDSINRLFFINGSGDQRLYVIDVLADVPVFSGPGGDLASIARNGDFYPASEVYWGINDSGTDTRSLVRVNVKPTSNNELTPRYTTVDQLETMVFINLSSGGSGGGDSGSCFIRSMLKRH